MPTGYLARTRGPVRSALERVSGHARRLADLDYHAHLCLTGIGNRTSEGLSK